MEEICVDRLPPLSAKYLWLAVQNLEAENDLFFCTLHDQQCQYRCQIPELVGKRIWRCFNDWVILSNYAHNNMWYLWNPVTCKIIRLPLLILKNGKSESIDDCCLSSPPDDPSSVLLLLTDKPTIVFCRLNCKRKRLKWTEMSYAKRLKDITGFDDGFLHSLTCCNGKIYALNTFCDSGTFVHIDIVVKDREVVITLLSIEELPYPVIFCYSSTVSFLKGYGSELFYIKLGFESEAKNTLCAVHLFRLDMINMMWEEMEDLKDAIFFLDLADDYFVYYIPRVASELGGYIHILGRKGKVIHSYDVNKKIVSLSYMPCSVLPTSHVFMWESSRLVSDHADHQQEEEDKENETAAVSPIIEPPHDDSRLVNLPFDVLETIMKFCVGVEYLKFRATCKLCQLAAPMKIGWRSSKRLQTYSLVSPCWLMVFDKHQGIITFTDPMFGDNYFIKTPKELIGELQIHCCMYGWLLMRKRAGPLMFFNPFTSDIRELPLGPYLDSYCFSAPPTCPDCMVVGFTPYLEWHVYIHFVAREPSWRRFILNDPCCFRFPTFCDQDIYALSNNGGVDCFMDIDNVDDFAWTKATAQLPRNDYCGNFLMKRDQHVLLVMVDEFGKSMEVFMLNNCTIEWEKIESLGRDMIFMGGSSCVCIEAKTREMENKIYFPRLHYVNHKIVFYSLETSKYHTFDNDKNVQQTSFSDFLDTKHHLNIHAWIQPTWS